MCDVDRFVDRLYLPVIEDLQLPHVVTEWNRYVVDLNRLPDDVDPETVVGSTNPPGKILEWATLAAHYSWQQTFACADVHGVAQSIGE